MSLASGKFTKMNVAHSKTAIQRVFPQKFPGQPQTTPFCELPIKDEVLLPDFGQVESLHISEVAVSSKKSELEICDL